MIVPDGRAQPVQSLRRSWISQGKQLPRYASSRWAMCAHCASGFSGSISNTGVNVTETNVIDTIAGLANARHIGVTLRGAMGPQVWLDYVKSVGSVFTPATGPGELPGLACARWPSSL